MQTTLAGTSLHPSAVHALIEIGARDATTAGDLCDALLLEKSTVSRIIGKLLDRKLVSTAAHRDDVRAKALTLTASGRTVLTEIDRYARAQVEAALDLLPKASRRRVSQGLSVYAEALATARAGGAGAAKEIGIVRGFRPGMIGRAVEMHARFYNRVAGFGSTFEGQVAAGMADFCKRLEAPCNGLWSAAVDDEVVGIVAIDGECPKSSAAHLRWFIVEDGFRRSGVGRRLLIEALAFCDAYGFRETHLWTFQGLVAARRLYESGGFVLVEERPGRQWGDEVIEQRFVRTAPRLREGDCELSSALT